MDLKESNSQSQAWDSKDQKTPYKNGDVEGLKIKHPAEEASATKYSHDADASFAFDVLLKQVGEFGPYQWTLWFMIGVGGFFTAFHNMGAVFLAATPKYSCDLTPPNGRDLGSYIKPSINVSVPWIRGKEGHLEPSKCKYYDYDQVSSIPQNYPSENGASNFSLPEEKFCQSWTYDDDIFKSTIVTEWDLVCDKRWMMSSAQATYMFGILIFALIFSAISDKIGRRVTALICFGLFFVTSVATAFSTSFTMFIILRFLVAGSGQGMVLSTYILLMESVSLRGRNVLGNSYHLFFAVGMAVLSLVAYYVNEWRTLQVYCSVPIVVLAAYFWFLPESPRWLLMQGREKEGLETLKRIAKANGKEFPSEQELKPHLTLIQNEVNSHKLRSVTLRENIKAGLKIVATLFRTPNLRRRNMIMFYCWFVTSTIYYGLVFSGNNINAHLHGSVALSGLIEIPAIVTLIVLLFRFERRSVLSMNFLLGGGACFSIIFVPSDMVGLNLALATFGKFTVSASFALVFMLSAELVPTDVRNISIGVASMCARFGSSIAPYIVDLLGDVYYAIPSTIFGVLAIAAGCLALLLPETGHMRLPESIEEIEALPR